MKQLLARTKSIYLLKCKCPHCVRFRNNTCSLLDLDPCSFVPKRKKK